MADFHFLRPFWLLLLLAIPLLPLIYRKARQSDSGWTRVIPETLLRPVISRYGQSGTSGRSPLVISAAAALVLAIALAGPAWRQVPTPLQQQNDSLVIVLDLSLSMLATDVEPDRLTLAKRKIRDILQQRDGSLTALVVYAADAHAVSPLTDDRNTITGMLDVLDPVIMPAPGNRVDLGVALGHRLLEQGAPGKGQMLLITDNASDRYQDRITQALEGSRFALNTLTVGTAEGGPIPLPKQGFIRENGEIVMTKASPSALQHLARNNGGQSHKLTIDDTDIHQLGLRPEDSEDWEDSERELTVDRFQDDGYWLLWLTLPLVLIGWRKGALALILFTLLPLTPRPAMALSWADLWAREDQRAPAMIANDPAAAAPQLSDPEWRGSAQYRSEDYESAAETLARAETPLADYNRGNALARAGKLGEAMAAYDEALADDPQMEDALFNRKIVEDLLNQQQAENESDDGDGDSSDDGDSQDGNDGSQDNQGQQESEDGTGGQDSQQQGDQANSQQTQQNGQNGNQGGEQSAEAPSPSAQQSGDGEGGSEGQKRNAPAEVSDAPLTQGQEQWLRRIPDDPGGLLRRKFLQQYQQRDTQSEEGDTPW
ncbi:VWA domain-containing protein [Marinobacter sp.]|uniref:VWA domain-containing protein n=1 Tax=Marinobacter sp. TaxID=50741 RepID=UPI0034A2E6C3